LLKDSDKRFDFESYKTDCKDKFLKDKMFEGALLHYLYLVSDSSISVAEM